MMDTMALTLLQKWVALDNLQKNIHSEMNYARYEQKGKYLQLYKELISVSTSKGNVETEMKAYVKAIHEVDKETKESPV